MSSESDAVAVLDQGLDDVNSTDAQTPPTEEYIALAAGDATPTNAKLIVCPWCSEKILKPEAAEYRQAKLFLPFASQERAQAAAAAAAGGQGECLQHHYVVTSRFAFENIGVTRGVDASTASQYRYLSCATCDRGPVGKVYFGQTGPPRPDQDDDESQPRNKVQEVYYVSHARVKFQ